MVVLAGGPGRPRPAQPKLTVGVVHLGSITDGGYNQAHAEGVQAMKKICPDVEVIQVENVPEGADAERVMENMINAGRPDDHRRRASAISSRRCGSPRSIRT